MIGIITALNQELEAFLNLCEDISLQEIKGIKFYQATLKKQPVVVVTSGVGKVYAALVTTALIENYPIKFLINVGSAGGLKEDLIIGDVIIGRQVAEADFDLTAFGYQRSFQETKITSTVSSLLSLKINQIITKQERVYFGDIVSSDQFISENTQLDLINKYFPTALCADMEAAAIAKVANFYHLDWLIIRSISDLVFSSNNVSAYQANLKKASQRAAQLALNFINLL